MAPRIDMRQPRKVVELGILLLAIVAGTGVHAHAPAVRASGVLTVDSTLDSGDASPGDGVCNDGSGHCTLRAAIEESNALAGADVIFFFIAGGGGSIQTFTPSTPYPSITDPVSIDGTTQGGFAQSKSSARRAAAVPTGYA